MRAIKNKIKHWLKDKLHKIIDLSARNQWVRFQLSRFLRQVIASLPASYSDYAKNRWAADLAQLLHESLQGAWIYRSHNFGRILGDTKVISFIFPYYKKKNEIIKAIQTLKNQRYENLKSSDIEIIVIDDGSDDQLDEVIPSDIIYIRRNRFKYGISRSRNLGAKISSGRVLVFVDPDFIFPEDYVENLYSEYLHYGKETIISGYIYDYFYMGCEDPRVAFGAWERPNRKTRRFLQLAGGHMAIDRDIFFRIGGFDEDLIYGEVEDTYFGYLLSKERDLSIVFSSKMVVWHVPHPVGIAHAEPHESFRVATFKDPGFFKSYVLEGNR